MANDKKPSIPLCIIKDNAFNNVQLSLLMDGGCGEQEGRLWVDLLRSGIGLTNPPSGPGE